METRNHAYYGMIIITQIEPSSRSRPFAKIGQVWHDCSSIDGLLASVLRAQLFAWLQVEKLFGYLGEFDENDNALQPPTLSRVATMDSTELEWLIRTDQMHIPSYTEATTDMGLNTPGMKSIPQF